jgi:hypothetical protein
MNQQAALDAQPPPVRKENSPGRLSLCRHEGLDPSTVRKPNQELWQSAGDRYLRNDRSSEARDGRVYALLSAPASDLNRTGSLDAPAPLEARGSLVLID